MYEQLPPPCGAGEPDTLSRTASHQSATGPTSLTCRRATHTCALRSNTSDPTAGELTTYWQIGSGTAFHRQDPVPIEQSRFRHHGDDRGRRSHLRAALTRRVKCWGRNHEGQVGDGSTTVRYTPTLGARTLERHRDFGVATFTPVRGSRTAPSSVGGTTSTAGSVTARPRPDSPPPRCPDSRASRDRSGTGTAPARVLDDATVKCWGYNTIAVSWATASTTRPTHPQRVTGLSNVTAIAAGRTAHLRDPR